MPGLRSSPRLFRTEGYQLLIKYDPAGGVKQRSADWQSAFCVRLALLIKAAYAVIASFRGRKLFICVNSFT